MKSSLRSTVMKEFERDQILDQAKAELAAGSYDKVATLLTPLAMRGDREAQFILGYLYFTDCDDYPAQSAYDWLRKAADQGHAEACYYLSRFPSSSEFEPPRSESDSVQLLITAGELGSLRAQYDLGACYATGDWPGEKDQAQAVAWYKKAAERGHPEAQYNLGLMLLAGEGTPINLSAGIEWLERAAAQGFEEGMRLLVDIYREGRFGVGTDREKAEYWEKRL
jgi:TPR repeat protein